MELVFILRLLYRKKWIILSCALLAMITAFLLTMNKKRMYKSFSQLSTGFTVSEDIKLSNDIFNIPQIDVKFNNAIENITSPKVLSLLSYSLVLHDLTSPTPFRKPDLGRVKDKNEIINFDKKRVVQEFRNKSDSMLLLNPSNPEEKRLMNLLTSYSYNIEAIKNELIVMRYQRTDYINITFLSENPLLSAYVVNELGKEFQRYFLSFRRERSDQSIVEIDSLVKKKKLELDQLLAIKTQFMTDSSVLDAGTIMSREQQASTYETALAEERGKVQNLTYQVQQLDRQIKALEAGAVKTKRTAAGTSNDEYMILRNQYNELYSDFVKNGSSDQATKKRLDDIKAKMLQAQLNEGGTALPDNDPVEGTAAQIGNLLQRKIGAEGELKSAVVKVDFYQRALSHARGGVSSQAGKNASLEQINKEIEIATTEYTAAKDRLNMASNMVDLGPSNFKQTVFGQPAYVPESSGRLPIIALSGLTSFILVCAIFIFIQFFDQSIKTPSSFQRLTGLKLLGVTGWIPLKGHKISDHVVLMDTESEVTAHSRNNSFRELLRKLRFEIEHSGKRIFLFTSTEPQQGKTTLIQALAFSLSLGRKKVLILDTNFCNNDLTVANEANPTLEKFSGNGKEEQFSIESIKQLITKTDVENVDIIGCRGGDYTPSEILPKNHLLNYLPDLLNEYTYIFMEGAPLNGFTDTKELVQYADAVIAIFSAQAEVRQPDKESIHFLKGLKTKFLGGILNKVDPQNVNF